MTRSSNLFFTAGDQILSHNLMYIKVYVRELIYTFEGCGKTSLTHLHNYQLQSLPMTRRISTARRLTLQVRLVLSNFPTSTMLKYATSPPIEVTYGCNPPCRKMTITSTRQGVLASNLWHHHHHHHHHHHLPAALPESRQCFEFFQDPSSHGQNVG